MRDARGLVLDFHSLRHGFVTAICRANVSPRVMMELARHSDPRLTMKRYSRVSASDVVAAMDMLPKLDAPDAETRVAVLRATGTDDARAEAAQAAERATDGPMAGGRDEGRPSGQTPAENVLKLPVRRFAKSFAKPCSFSRAPSHDDARKEEWRDRKNDLENPVETAYSAEELDFAGVAQLDRASDYGSEGYRFNSCRP